MTTIPVERRQQRDSLWPALGVVALVISLIGSVFVGAADITVWDALTGGLTEAHRVYLVEARLPRTAAAALACASLAIAGLLMQLLTRNRFVEPSTAGTVESAGLGLVAVAIIAPGAPIVAKMLVAMVFALGGTALFLACIRRVPVSDSFVVPLIGIMLGSVIGAVAAFLALSRDLLQMLNSWMLADFSAVLAGRYELLWLVAVLGALAYIAADRFTVAGLGEDVSTGLGLNHRAVVAAGMAIVAAVAAVVVVTVGALPLLGLVVPNVVSRLVGDDARRGLPLVALLGAVTVLVCDMVGRSLPGLFAGGAPGAGEVPVGTIVGILGGAVFLAMMLRGVRNA